MKKKARELVWAGVFAMALALCLGSVPVLAQNQDQLPPNQPESQPQTTDPAELGQADAEANTREPVVPAALTLSAGTVIPVRVMQRLSSKENQVGDRFSATLEQPMVANGWVVARRGQIVTGRVVVAQKARHGERSQLGVQLIDLTLVDGKIVPIDTQLSESSATGSTPKGRDVSIIAATTGIGTIIGAAAGGGTGAAIGAGLGATAGAATVLSTPGSPTVIYPEDLLTFRLESPLTISTRQSQVAFHPVTQSDYSNPDQDAYARPHLERRADPYYPGPVYYYAPYAYPYGWGYYPYGPSIGFYGVWGYGPRFYGGFREGREFHGFRGRGFRRR